MKAKLPTALDSEHQKLLDDLKAKNGKDFNQGYDQIQVKAHRMRSHCPRHMPGAGEDDAELKDWAGKTLPHLKEHLSMAEKLECPVAPPTRGGGRIPLLSGGGPKTAVSGATPPRASSFQRICLRPNGRHPQRSFR